MRPTHDPNLTTQTTWKLHDIGVSKRPCLISMYPANATLEIHEFEKETLTPHTVCLVAKKT
jgi:hypothetical protein